MRGSLSFARADDAEFVFRQRLAQLGQFAHATHKRRVVFDEVVGGTARTLGAVQSLADGGVKLFQRLPDVRLLQSPFARVVPRAQIESLAALNLVNPARDGLVGFRIGGVGQGDKKDGRDAFAEALAHGFVADVIFPFPSAVGAGEVMGREHGKTHLRLAQAALNLLPPVIHAGNLVRVEEHPQVAPGERAEGGFDLRFERGHLPAFIVASRITNEEVAGQWQILSQSRLRGFEINGTPTWRHSGMRTRFQIACCPT